MSISITDFHQVVESNLFSYTYYQKLDIEVGFREWNETNE